MDQDGSTKNDSIRKNILPWTQSKSICWRSFVVYSILSRDIENITSYSWSKFKCADHHRSPISLNRQKISSRKRYSSKKKTDKLGVANFNETAS